MAAEFFFAIRGMAGGIPTVIRVAGLVRGSARVFAIEVMTTLRRSRP
jgi:hypothetical protein